ncbi:MAG: hypothetical protein L3J75_04045 [Methylococcaceae bacterium]|nr:hypothetical protein [Methylococcaceae bacterium]
MGCCDDPTEPVKINRSDLVRVQEQYGNLLRDLFTSDPEKVILKQLNQANAYLTELAALNAHYDSVRKRAIELLEQDSICVLKQIADKNVDNEFGQYALERMEDLKKDRGLLAKFFN